MLGGASAAAGKGELVKERQILFSAAMVRAILEGRKSQTRRVVKPQPSEDWHPDPVGWYAPTMVDKHGEEYPGKDVYGASDEDEGRICPYGVPGDRLWVRETFNKCGCNACRAAWPKRCPHRVTYVATYGGPSGIALTPSIFMPRWASRITLEITDVRVQRLQEISFEDCLAEGIISTEFWDKVKGSEIEELSKVHPKEWTVDQSIDQSWIDYTRLAYRELWDSINGKTHPWSSNPWLWCLTFKRVAA